MLELLGAIFKPIGFAVEMYIMMGAIGKLISTLFMMILLTALFFRLCC